MIAMAAAGACGAIVRYLIELTGINARANTSPWLTMFANIVGAFIAGFTVHSLVLANGLVISSNLAIGFCGGLTTFSSAFAIPMLFEKRDKSYGLFLIVLTPALCAAAFLYGISLHKSGSLPQTKKPGPLRTRLRCLPLLELLGSLICLGQWREVRTTTWGNFHRSCDQE